MMKNPLRAGVLGLAALGMSALIVSGCSQRTQSGDSAPIAQAPPTSATPQTPEAQTPEAQTPPKKSAPAPRTLKAPAKTAPAKAVATKIHWEPTLELALARARKTQKPVMIDFFATWCGPCKMLDHTIYPAKPVVQEAQNFVSVKVDVDKQQALALKYQIEAMPTIVFLDASGREIHRTQGVSDQASWFVQEMQMARSKISATAA